MNKRVVISKYAPPKCKGCDGEPTTVISLFDLGMSRGYGDPSNRVEFTYSCSKCVELLTVQALRQHGFAEVV